MESECVFQIDTYIRRKGVLISDLEDLNTNPDHYFFNIQDSKEMEGYNHYPEPMEGVITINYYERSILDFSSWDLVNPLWSYLLEVTESVINTGYGATYFPEQPLQLELKMVSREFLLFLLDEGRMTNELLPVNKFLTAFLQAAKAFFEYCMTYFPGTYNFHEEIKKITLLKDKLRGR